MCVMYLKKIDFMWTMNQMAFKNINWISFLGIFRGLIQKKALEQDVMLWRHDDESVRDTNIDPDSHVQQWVVMVNNVYGILNIMHGY